MTAEAPDRIAIETALWLKALLFGGSAEELIKMSMTGKIKLISTEAQIERLLTVMRDRLLFSETALSELRIFITDLVETVSSETEVAAGVPENISPILYAARMGAVTAIATTERSHLLNLESFEGIPIVSVA